MNTFIYNHCIRSINMSKPFNCYSTFSNGPGLSYFLSKQTSSSPTTTSAKGCSSSPPKDSPKSIEPMKGMKNVKHVILVASGKGGVGKSTVCVNLAAAMSRIPSRTSTESKKDSSFFKRLFNNTNGTATDNVAQGDGFVRVGILDADIYGPSIPGMLGLSQKKASLDQNNRFLPIYTRISYTNAGDTNNLAKSDTKSCNTQDTDTSIMNDSTTSTTDTSNSTANTTNTIITSHVDSNWSIPTMSMSYVMKDSLAPVVWRGPMLIKAVQQLIHQVEWPDLDVLLVDMPPGTGDVHLTIAQNLNVSAAVIVSTPQAIALNSAIKGLRMFGQVEIPVAGVILNMAHQQCTHCGHLNELFGSAQLTEELAAREGTKLLGRIPLEQPLAHHCDLGVPMVLAQPNSTVSVEFTRIAHDLLKAFK